MPIKDKTKHAEYMRRYRERKRLIKVMKEIIEYANSFTKEAQLSFEKSMNETVLPHLGIKDYVFKFEEVKPE